MATQWARRFKVQNKDVFLKGKRKKTGRLCLQKGVKPHPAAPNMFWCPAHHRLKG